MTRYCAHTPCNKAIKQRSNENAEGFGRRRFCSSWCSDRKSNTPPIHGSLKGYSYHWHREEPACHLCLMAIERELAKMRRAA